MRYVWKIGCESEITQLNKRHHYRRMEDERRRSLPTFSYLKFHYSERCVYLYYTVLICSLKTPGTSEQWRSVTLLNSPKLYFGYTLLAIETKQKKHASTGEFMYTKCLYKLDISVWFGLFTTPAQLSKT